MAPRPGKRKRDEEFPLSRQDSTKQPTQSSLLRNTTEEVSFPRGGGSVLSPLEIKQVSNEAAADALFGTSSEERSAKRNKLSKGRSTHDLDDDKDNDGGGGNIDYIDSVEGKPTHLIRHLAFSNLKVGSILLGQISSISKSNLYISLPDGFVGRVDLAHISDPFTEILEELDREMEEEEEEEGNEGDGEEEYDSSDDEGERASAAKGRVELPNLHDFCQVGQWLRCAVVANTALDRSGKPSRGQRKHRIELTIEPSVVNRFTEEDLTKSAVVQCSVKSIEDHGAILDTGVKGITGFISKNDVPNFSDLRPGAVFLGSVTKRSGRTVNVSMKFHAKKGKITQVSSVEAALPGQVVDLLCERITDNGISGKVFGLIPAVIPSSQLRMFNGDKLKEKYSVGSNILCRIIGALQNREGENVLLLSTSSHILRLEKTLKALETLKEFPIGYIFESTKVLGTDSGYLYLALDEERIGKAHKSQLKKLEMNDNFRARVLGYDSMDCMFVLSIDPAVVDAKYLRPRDIPIGELLSRCEITDVSSKRIELRICNGQFTAVVPPLHMADFKLFYPERKFKIGSKVKGRVIAVDRRGHIFVTLKKSLVELDPEETPIVSTYDIAKTVKEEGQKTLATVERFRPGGCIITFFGEVRGFLPNAEISEVYVRRPEDHLRLGQTVTVKLLQVIPETSRVLATCKLSQTSSTEQVDAIESLIPGRTVIEVHVVEKTKDSLIVETKDSNLRGVIYVGHLSDSKLDENRAAIKKVSIGSTLKGLVIDKDERTRVFNLTLKKSLIEDAEKGTLPTSYEEIQGLSSTTPLHGYVKSVTEKGIFVAFNGKFVGLVLPSYAVESRDVDITKAFYTNQSVTAYLLRTDDAKQRFLLTLRDTSKLSVGKGSAIEDIKAVDPSVRNYRDFTLGRVVEGRIKSVKQNQLNVVLADHLYGRVDISEIFDSFDEISNKQEPLTKFKKGETIRARIIGMHDVKTRKFLPMAGNVSKGDILELSMRKQAVTGKKYKVTSLTDIKSGENLVGYVNNHGKDMMWLTISPLVRARIDKFNLIGSEKDFDNNIEEVYPLGSAVDVKVLDIDLEHAVVKVTSTSHLVKDITDIRVGDKLPASIVKISDSYVLLDLGNGLTGISFITDALDDFSISLKDAFREKLHKIVPSTVLSVDMEDKKINLSLRGKDPATKLVTSHSQLKPGEIVNAIVKNVTDKGIFVYLSRDLQAFIPISKLSDSYLKEWKKFFRPMQHVIGKVVQCDADDRILLTLRESEINGELKVLKTYDDIKVGDVFDGFVKNVTDFGVFIKLENTNNVSGLAHKSEISDEVPDDITSLFGPGDRVKAIVIKKNPDKKQLSLSLKASHFSKTSKNSTVKSEGEEEDAGEVQFAADYSDSDVEIGDAKDEVRNEMPAKPSSSLGLSAEFDWTAGILDQAQESDSSDSEEEVDFTVPKKHKHKRNGPKLSEDKTIDINTRAPESASDFERLIIGNPNSSVVWMNYMAFQLQLSEIDKAREIAERALKTINFREEAEKLNIWIAMLNLENTFGTPETLDEVFRRACQYMDSYTIHSKLLTIFQMSEKLEQAEDLFKVTAKKFGSEKVSIWVSWGDFLLSHGRREEVATVLSNALKALPKRSHIDVVRRFALLEFSKGEAEKGRSLFEGLLADAPKRIDIWNVYIDQEIKFGEKSKVEDLFERVITKKITRKQAKFFFSKWLEYEESKGDEKGAEYVKALAMEYVEKHGMAKGET